MKKRVLTGVLAAALLAGCGGKTMHLVTENTTPLSCVDVRQVNSASAPPAILQGARACMAEGDYRKAAALAGLAGAYGRYDTRRVADMSAHRSIVFLNLSVVEGLTDEQRSSFMEAFHKRAVEGNEENASTCADIAAVGKPRYYPQYMISRGNAAARKAAASTALVPDFDPEVTWAEVLRDTLNCR